MDPNTQPPTPQNPNQPLQQPVAQQPQPQMPVQPQQPMSPGQPTYVQPAGYPVPSPQKSNKLALIIGSVVVIVLASFGAVLALKSLSSQNEKNKAISSLSDTKKQADDSGSNATAANFSLVTEPKMHFSMQIPKDWTRKVVDSSEFSDEVSYTSNLSSDIRNIQYGSVSVLYEHTKYDMLTQQQWDDTAKHATEILTKSSTNIQVTVLSRGLTTINGHHAYVAKIKNVYTLNGKSITQYTNSAYVFISGKEQYNIITASYEGGDVGKQLDKSLDSFTYVP